MKKLVLISMVVLLIAGLGVSSQAAEKKRGMRGNMAACEGNCGCDEAFMEKFKALSLDEKQRESVQAIHFRTKKDMVRKKADVQVAEIELKEVLSKDPVDLKAAEAAVKKGEGLKSEMKMMHIKAHEEIKGTLTPEQRKQFISTMSKGPMGHAKCMHKKCNLHGMGGMENMEQMGPGHQDGGTSPVQHKHN